MESLKEVVTSSESKRINFNVQPDSTFIDTWIGSRSHDKYIENFIQKVIYLLRKLVFYSEQIYFNEL